MKTGKYILGLFIIFLASQIFGTEETEYDIAGLQLCFLKSMYRPDENHNPFFFQSKTEDMFWGIADKYLKNKGILENEFRSEESIQSLVDDLQVEMKEKKIAHKAAFLAGIYQQHGTEEGFRFSGVSDILGMVMEVFGFYESLNAKVSPGYPGSTTIEFEGHQDRENFKLFMNRIYAVIREDRPISDIIDPFTNPWATSIDARIYHNPTSRSSKSR